MRAARTWARCRCSRTVNPSPRALATNRSSTAQQRLRQLVSPGNRPITLRPPQHQTGSQTANLGQPPGVSDLGGLHRQLAHGSFNGGARRYPRGHGVVLLGVVTAEGYAVLLL